MPQDPQKKKISQPAFDPEAYLKTFDAEAYLQGQQGFDPEAYLQTSQTQDEPSLDSRLTGIIQAPVRQMVQGYEQFKGGNYPAGAMNMMAGVLNQPFVPIGAAAELVGEIPYVGKPLKAGLEKVAQVPPWLMKTGINALETGMEVNRALPTSVRATMPAYSALSEIAGNEREILGQTPQQYEATKQGAENVGSALSYYVAPDLKSQFNKSVVNPMVDRYVQHANESRLNTWVETMSKKAPLTSGELKNKSYPDILKRSAKYVAEDMRQNKIVLSKDVTEKTATQQVYDSIGRAKTAAWETVTEQVDRHPQSLIAREGAGEAARGVIDNNMQRHNAKKAKAIEEYADTFTGNSPLREVHDYITELNETSASFWKASPSEKGVMLAKDPVLEAKLAVADHYRNQLFDTLEAYGEKGTPELRQDFGALSTAQTAVGKRLATGIREQLRSGAKGWFSTPLGTIALVEGSAGMLVHQAFPVILGTLAGALRHFSIERASAESSFTRATNALGRTDLQRGFRSFPADVTNTPTAVSFGKGIKNDRQAMILWEQSKLASEEVHLDLTEKKPVPKDKAFAPQLLRERVEGYIAKVDKTDHQAMTPEQIDSWFQKRGAENLRPISRPKPKEAPVEKGAPPFRANVRVQEASKTPRTRWGNANPEHYPALGKLGRASINPIWVVDRKTGKVRVAGEYEDIDPYFLNLKGKPTPSQLQGGKGMGFDKEGMRLKGVDTYAGELGFESGDAVLEQLRQDLENHAKYGDDYVKGLLDEQMRNEPPPF